MSVITNNNIKSTVALASLENVEDPEIGLNVVDLGLIYQINFNEPEKKIICIMTLTTQFCPMGESITSNVKSALKNTFTDTSIEVILTFEPAWSYDLISEEGRLFLNK